jgi:hypothetical protein
MTTYLSFLSWYLAPRWDKDENQETAELFRQMALTNPGTQIDGGWLDEIYLGLNRNDIGGD